jgi:hypothetical protein
MSGSGRSIAIVSRIQRLASSRAASAPFAGKRSHLSDRAPLIRELLDRGAARADPLDLGLEVGVCAGCLSVVSTCILARR